MDKNKQITPSDIYLFLKKEEILRTKGNVLLKVGDRYHYFDHEGTIRSITKLKNSNNIYIGRLFDLIKRY
jgi:hypothetical protein